MDKKSLFWRKIAFLGGISILTLIPSLVSPVFAETKIFSAAGDGGAWMQAANWSPVSVPGSDDDLTIDLEDAVVTVNSDFAAASLIVGGRNASLLEVPAFVDGTIAPESNLDNALWVRQNGRVVFHGAGTVTLKGTMKLSRENLADEPSPMVVLL